MSKAGFIAIIGTPNAGKSTLMNRILGQKIAIATHKVQTTRTNMRGIHTRGDSQFIFVDTPGIHKPRRNFDKAMVNAANQAWIDADVVLLLIDTASGLKEGVENIIHQLEGVTKPILVALNKVDKIKKEKLLPLISELNSKHQFSDIFAISALNGSGVEDVLNRLETFLPESPFLFDPEDLTDTPMRLIAAEITREKAFMCLHEELPYALMVETVSYKADTHQVTIHQNIIVERDGHKGIVLGKGGETVKKIGSQARRELEEMLQCKVNLFLKVKVRPNWSENKSMMQMIGLEPPK